MQDNFDVHSWNLKRYLNEDDSQSLGDELSNKFDLRIYDDNGRITIQQKGDVEEEIFNDMIEYIENKGFKVDRDQSYKEFDSDDDRYWYPRIVIKKS